LSSCETTDNVPTGSLLKHVEVKKLQDCLFIYTRLWRIGDCIKLIGKNYFTSENWLQKIDLLFISANIEKKIIKALYFNHTSNNIYITFYSNRYKDLAKEKLLQYGAKYYKF